MTEAISPKSTGCPSCDAKPDAAFRHLPEGNGFCQKCNACLYEHSTQIPDDMYPFFKCTLCGQVNFWD